MLTHAHPVRADVESTRTGRPVRRRWRSDLSGWLFALPFTAIFLLFMALPLAWSAYMVFTDMTASDIRSPLSVNFIGLDNVVELLTDPKFLQSAVNTVYFVGVGVPLTLCVSLILAALLNSGFVRLRSLFRVGYYVPVVTSIVAVAVVWKVLLQPEFGVVNIVLSWIGVPGINWLQDPTWAMPSLIAMAVWRNSGYSMVILLAGLQAIPRDLYEQSSIDGAGPVRQFFSVTVPLLRPTLLFCAIITGIGYMQFFEEPFVMTSGGPLGTTTSITMEIYSQFGFGNYGYAAAMSWVLFLATVLLSLLQFRLFRPRTES